MNRYECYRANKSSGPPEKRSFYGVKVVPVRVRSPARRKFRILRGRLKKCSLPLIRSAAPRVRIATACAGSQFGERKEKGKLRILCGRLKKCSLPLMRSAAPRVRIATACAGSQFGERCAFLGWVAVSPGKRSFFGVGCRGPRENEVFPG